MQQRQLGQTDINVSPLGLGTVKFGRNQQVKYPTDFDLPDDKTIDILLHQAFDLGINLLDTSPAYGLSMKRLGKLLSHRKDWVIVSKAGEIFENNQSSFDFSYDGTIKSVENQLKTLKTDYLDVLLIHSDGQDQHILSHEGIHQAVIDLKQRGLIRAHGISSKTVDGGKLALETLDIAMVTCNLNYNGELAVLEAAREKNKGILIKKGFLSGHLQNYTIKEMIQFIFSQPQVSSLIAGTINPEHLAQNVTAVRETLES